MWNILYQFRICQPLFYFFTKHPILIYIHTIYMCCTYFTQWIHCSMLSFWWDVNTTFIIIIIIVMWFYRIKDTSYTVRQVQLQNNRIHVHTLYMCCTVILWIQGCMLSYWWDVNTIFMIIIVREFYRIKMKITYPVRQLQLQNNSIYMHT